MGQLNIQVTYLSHAQNEEGKKAVPRNNQYDRQTRKKTTLLVLSDHLPLTQVNPFVVRPWDPWNMLGRTNNSNNSPHILADSVQSLATG